MAKKIKKDKSPQHLAFFSVLDSSGVQRPIPEYEFHRFRLWRFDYAWPLQKIALEVEGGIFIQGRHSRGMGMKGDFEKYNEAAIYGWRIIKVVPKELVGLNTIKLLKRILKTEP